VVTFRASPFALKNRRTSSSRRIGSGPASSTVAFNGSSTATLQFQLSLYAEFLERLSVGGRFKRQPHIKLCAVGTRAEVDFSVMPFDDDPVADNQAESGA
jgi:hypothetical protein